MLKFMLYLVILKSINKHIKMFDTQLKLIDYQRRSETL